MSPLLACTIGFLAGLGAYFWVWILVFWDYERRPEPPCGDDP